MKTSEPSTQKSAGINIGSASLVMVFAVLSLTVFAVLSLVTANNELKLAKKYAYSIENYYSADLFACDILDNVKKGMEKNEPINVDGVQFENNIGYFNLPINDGQSLSVSFDIENGDIDVLSWQIVNTTEQIYDNSLNIWSGD